MKAIKISEIANIVGGTLHGAGEEIVNSVEIDSRKVRERSMFAALSGKKVDGHDYIGKAFKNGAVCCIGSYIPAGETRPIIIVEDVQKALQELAGWYRNTLMIPVIGITGSVGKTTTKEMVASVLETRFHVLKTHGSLNNELGLPLTLLRIEREHECAVVEMGVSHFHEMSILAKMTRPDIGIFTMIGHAHMENFGDRHGILRAKTEMLDYMDSKGTMIVNGDDDLLSTYVPDGKKKLAYGKNPCCDVRIMNLQTDSFRTVCDITNGERCIHATVNEYGDHIVYAMMAAVTVGICMGLTDEQIRLGLMNYRTVGSRARVMSTKGHLTIIDDCYNASPESMRNAMLSMKHFQGRRKIAILGDMLELGDNEAKHHYALGELTAECGIDLLFGIGDLSAYTVMGAIVAGGVSMHFENKEQLINQLPTILHNGDVVLVKASHAMGFEVIVDAILTMDLRETDR